ncbi:exocyst complex component EXO70C1-like [Silene latifolia]|uniref:exocyst complex component EXO70C1-like n=1 Tax=Silene latifolia TaxID=37657 RepID=UPI003D76B8C7
MANNAPLKSLSFDSRIYDENKGKNEDNKNVGKSFSFASRATSFKSDHDDSVPPTIDEGGEEEQSECLEFTMEELSEEIDAFLQSADSMSANAGETGELMEITASVVMFLKKLELMIEEYESTSETTAVIGRNVDEDSLFLASVNRLSSLITVLNGYKSDHTMLLRNQASLILHRVMMFLEDELRLLLAESAGLTPNSADNNSKSKNGKGAQNTPVVASPQDQQQQHSEGDQGLLSDQNLDSGESVKESPPTFPYYSPESVSSIHLVSSAMHNAGYEAECISIFIIVRRHAIEEEVKKHGFEKISVDDVQKMNWESLEREITTWIGVFKHCSNELFPGEEKFYETVFSDHLSTKCFLFCDISLAVSSILISFAEAVSMTKRSTEKLFKFLDMYEALRDWIPSTMLSEEVTEELRSEVSFAKSRLGEAAVTIFCLLENSIKGDNTKTPVPNGAVHPLTRYCMNYLEYACEYKDTLEQVFQQHLKTDESEEYPSDTEQRSGGGGGGRNAEPEKHSPFSSQLITIMDLLDTYLDSKSKLYKDLSLRYVFLMNNGRYMLQKVKGSTEIHQGVGDNWCRKRSSDVRHYHKSYQRESWSRVLQCLNHEGLQVNGKIHKPILKERFKNFNQLFDEIHKTQCSWVVSDEQLQSELRVSISAVMIPAYRSFVARFGQIFTPGRQVEKYIKFQPDDIENAIEELFDGNTNSMAKRKG